MRTGALVLGIIAGLAGLISAVAALFIGGIGGAFEAEGRGLLSVSVGPLLASPW
jgi:hypothetical protein